MLSQGFKSEAAQPLSAFWRIFPLAPRHHGNLAMAAQPRPWHPVLLFPASLCLKGRRWCSVGFHISPIPVRSGVQREVPLGCVLAVVLPAHHLKGMNQTKVIL